MVWTPQENKIQNNKEVKIAGPIVRKKLLSCHINSNLNLYMLMPTINASNQNLLSI
jgi:hypothetical protein